MPNDDSFPWSEFPERYLTRAEIEAAFDEANDADAMTLPYNPPAPSCVREPANAPR